MNIDGSVGRASSALPSIGIKPGVHVVITQEQTINQNINYLKQIFGSARESWKVYYRLQRVLKRSKI